MKDVLLDAISLRRGVKYEDKVKKKEEKESDEIEVPTMEGTIVLPKKYFKNIAEGQDVAVRCVCVDGEDVVLIPVDDSESKVDQHKDLKTAFAESLEEK